MPKYSIIIPTYNHLEDYLKPCINSIIQYTNLDEVEIIVIAQGKQKYVPSVLIKMLEFDEPLGYTKACNEGIKIATGEYIILLNDDTVLLGQPKNGWLEILERPFKEQEKVGVVGPIKFTWDCAGVQRTAIAFWCAMFKRQLLEEIGLLDEIFNPGMGEDGDFCIKAEMAGYKLVQVPVNISKEFGTGVSDQSFPIYHKGNGTFIYNTDFKNEAINKNKKILDERYGLKFKAEEPSRLEKIYNICLGHECDTNKLFPVLKAYTEKCESVIEMGVRGVFSTYAFLAGKPKKMVSYDIFTSPNINEAIEVAEENNIDFSFIEHDVLTTEIAETDLLFIDTLHVYRQLSQELKLHANKVRKYILLHDTNTWGGIDEIPDESSVIKQGLKLALDEFLAENPHWKIKEEVIESNGLTVLERIPKFSIVVPTNDYLEGNVKICLDRIFTYTNLIDKEVIVVANGCDDETQKYLKSLNRKITLLNYIYKLGQIDPVNLGGKVARGEFLVLIDDDSHLLEQPIDNWINILYEPFSNIGVAITGPLLADYPYLGSTLHSGCTMYRKEIWDKVGGADGEFGFGYLWDTDISLKVQQLGYKIVGVCTEKRNFPFYHPDSPVTTEDKKKDVILVRKNREILYRRYGMRPKYSVIVPTYNHLEDCLKPCLESFKQHTNLEEMEILVVANGCKDDTANYVDNLGYPFKLLWFDEGLGFAKAVNEGIKLAQGQYIIIVNNDVMFLEKGLPKHTWVQMLEEPFLKDEKMGITGPLKLFDRYADSEVMIFFCVMVKKELFDILGLLDESFWSGGEDIDFCVKALRAGYKQMQVPTQTLDFTFTNVGVFPVYHMGEGTLSKKEFPEYGNKIIKDNGLKNMVRYNKHIKLNLGSGGIEVPGYLSVDKYDERANLIMDVLEIDKYFPENSVEEILASHLFEHINPYNSVELLQKWCKILKPGGKLIMEVPNIEELCKDFVKAGKDERYGILNCVYGTVNTKAGGDKSEITSPHLWGWYPEMLGDHLVWAGYNNIIFMPEQIPHPHKNFRVEATKPVYELAPEAALYNGGERLIPGVTHDKEEEIRHRSSYEFFKDAISLNGNSSAISIVDLGCGVGWGCPLLATIPNSTILGIDISKECIDYANKHYPVSNVSYQTMSIEEFMNSDLQPDYIVSRGVLEHIDNLLPILKQLKYQKKLIFDVPYKEELNQHPESKNIHHKNINISEETFVDFPNAKFYYEDLEGKITSTVVATPINLMVVLEK